MPERHDHYATRITLNRSEIFLVRSSIEIPDFQGKYPELFQGELGTLAGGEAEIYIDPKTKPIFCKARPFPYFLKEKIEQSLKKLIAEGTLTPVQFSEWAAPILLIVKEDGSVKYLYGYEPYNYYIYIKIFHLNGRFPKQAQAYPQKCVLYIFQFR